MPRKHPRKDPAEYSAELETKKEKARVAREERKLKNNEKWKSSTQHMWMKDAMDRAGDRAFCIWHGDFGKAVFPIPAKSLAQPEGADVALCICDIVRGSDGSPIRKPAFRFISKAGAQKRLSFYEQAIIPLGLVPEVMEAMGKIIAAPETQRDKEMIQEVAEAASAPKKDEDLENRLKRFIF